MKPAPLSNALGLLAVACAACACTINPVTGDRELALVSAADEVAIGTAQYLPSQQMQGGQYLRDPALTSYVRSVGNRLGDVSDRGLPYEFVIIDSSVPNAWALPGGKIAINRGLLLELNSEAELAAVLGHEIVHAAARHGALAMQRGLLLQGAVAVAAVATRNDDYSSLAVGAAGIGARLISMRHGREAELESDAYGMRYMSRAGYDPQAAIDLQQTFVRLSEERNNRGWLAGLFASHPPSAERVAANRATAATLPASGTLGREAYMNATADLRRDAPGYERLDSARSALASGDRAAARREAEAALAILPNESGIEAVLGDIEMAENRPAPAAEHYGRALALNDRFFYYHLAMAEAQLALGQTTRAEADYRASIDLLPTADAYLGLGRIAESRGQRALALENYNRAAESGGPSGAAARRAAVRLDLPENPARYLRLTTGLDASGRLIVQLQNSTEVGIGGIALSVSYIESGQVRNARRALDGTLEAGATRLYSTGLGPFTASNQYQVVLDSARVIETR